MLGCAQGMRRGKISRERRHEGLTVEVVALAEEEVCWAAHKV